MIILWTSNNKKYFFFLSIVLVIGIIAGIFLIYNIDESSREIVLNNINEWILSLKDVHINNILSHLLILSLFLVIASFFIGMPLFIFYIFYNGFSIGFIISSLTSIFGFKGLLFSLLYIIVTKLVFIFFAFFFVIFLIKIGERVFLKFIRKKDSVKEELNILFKKSIVILFIILINDIFVFFLGGKILNIFNFLII